MAKYKFEIEDANGNVIPHYDVAENITFDKKNTTLQSETVQKAIEELSKKPSSPVVPGVNIVSGYYTILAEEWGLTKMDAYPERGKSYCRTREYLESADTTLLEQLNVSTEISYEDMHNNAVGIERAMDYAYEHGYHGVVLENGIYYIIPENIVTTTDVTDDNDVVYTKATTFPVAASICIIDKQDFVIDWNGSSFCAIINSNPPALSEGQYDTTFVNTYYKQYASTTIVQNNKSVSIKDFNKPIGSYSVQAHYFTFIGCKNVTMKNGIIRGDRYTRSFLVAQEAEHEQTYGIGTGIFSSNYVIENMDISGCMGDGIATSPYGEDIYIRNENGEYKELVSTQHTFRRYSKHLDLTHYSQPKTDITSGHTIPYYKGKGYVSDKTRSSTPAYKRLTNDYSVVSCYIPIGNPVDYGLYNSKDIASSRKALDIPYVKTLWDNKQFTILRKATTTEFNEYSVKVSVLTYSFPDDIAVVTINDFENTTLNGTYGFEISNRSSVNASSYDTSSVDNLDTAFRLYSIVNNVKTEITSSNANYNTIAQKVIRKVYNDIPPVRVIDSVVYNDVRFNPNENWCRLQTFFHKQDYDDDVFANGEFGEAVTGTTKFTSKTFYLGLYLACNDHVIINNCVIHDNHRGGVTGGIKNLKINNTKFYKHHKNTTNLIDSYGNAPIFSKKTNYAIDIEDNCSRNTEISSCSFEKANCGILAINCYNLNFHDNISWGHIHIQNCIHNNIHNNIFYGDGFGLAENDYRFNRLEDIPLSYTGGNKFKRFINFHDNICYAYKNSQLFRNIDNTVININNNILYLSPSDGTAMGRSVSNGLIDTLPTIIEATKNNTFTNNKVYALHAEYNYNNGTGYSYGLVATGIVSNNIIQYEGTSPNKFFVIFVSPKGVNISNIINGTSLYLGQTYNSTKTDALGTDELDGIVCYNAITFNLKYGNPTTKITVGNCIFTGIITLAYSKVSYTLADIPHAPVITLDNSYNYTTNRNVTISISTDDSTLMQSKSLKICWSTSYDNYQVGASNSSVQVTLENTSYLRAFVFVDDSSEVRGPITEQYILANEEPQYIDLGDDEFELIEQINHESVSGSNQLPGSYTPTLNFVDTRIDKPLASVAITGTKELVIDFNRCDFSNNEKSCIIEAQALSAGYATAEAIAGDDPIAYSGGVENRYYYDSTNEILYICQTISSVKKLVKVNLTINTNNCMANDDFTIIKDTYSS